MLDNFHIFEIITTGLKLANTEILCSRVISLKVDNLQRDKNDNNIIYGYKILEKLMFMVSNK